MRFVFDFPEITVLSSPGDSAWLIVGMSGVAKPLVAARCYSKATHRRRSSGFYRKQSHARSIPKLGIDPVQMSMLRLAINEPIEANNQVI